MLKVTVSANDALSIVSAIKKHNNTLQSCISSSSPGSNSFRFMSTPREGSTRKLSPGLDINAMRTESTRLEKDVRSIERAIYAFNSSTLVEFDGETYTVSQALNEIRDAGVNANKHYNNASSNVSYNFVEGDDLDGLTNISDTTALAVESVAKKVGLKSAVAFANSSVSVTFECESEFVSEIVAPFKQ